MDQARVDAPREAARAALRMMMQALATEGTKWAADEELRAGVEDIIGTPTGGRDPVRSDGGDSDEREAELEAQLVRADLAALRADKAMRAKQNE